MVDEKRNVFLCNLSIEERKRIKEVLMRVVELEKQRQELWSSLIFTPSKKLLHNIDCVIKNVLPVNHVLKQLSKHIEYQNKISCYIQDGGLNNENIKTQRSRN